MARGCASEKWLCLCLVWISSHWGLLKHLRFAVLASSLGRSSMLCILLWAYIEIHIHCNTLLKTYLWGTCVIHASIGLFPCWNRLGVFSWCWLRETAMITCTAGLFYISLVNHSDNELPFTGCFFDVYKYHFEVYWLEIKSGSLNMQSKWTSNRKCLSNAKLPRHNLLII